jgi:hypothetical protein
MQLVVEPPGIVDRINAALPANVRAVANSSSLPRAVL